MAPRRHPVHLVHPVRLAASSFPVAIPGIVHRICPSIAGETARRVAEGLVIEDKFANGRGWIHTMNPEDRWNESTNMEVRRWIFIAFSGCHKSYISYFPFCIFWFAQQPIIWQSNLHNYERFISFAKAGFRCLAIANVRLPVRLPGHRQCSLPN